MNIDIEHLQRRVAHIQDLIDNPSQLDIPNYDSNRPWHNYEIGETEITLLHLDNAISKSILNKPNVDKSKLLLSKQLFKTIGHNLLTDYLIGIEDGEHWLVDYCFYNTIEGVQYPYALGVDVEDDFNGWWVHNPKVSTHSSLEIGKFRIYRHFYTPIFFVTSKTIFVASCLAQCYPMAERLEDDRKFASWLIETKNNGANILQENLTSIRENCMLKTQKDINPLLDYLNKI